MSTCIDTSNYDEDDSTWKPTWNGMYVKTIIDPCLDCINMPVGEKYCQLSMNEVIYCRANNHCFRKLNPDVVIYANLTKEDDFIDEEEFEI